jgi:hypothetical protein
LYSTRGPKVIAVSEPAEPGCGSLLGTAGHHQGAIVGIFAECEAACHQEISIESSARMNRDFIRSQFGGS